jgi:hypothetical protein
MANKILANDASRSMASLYVFDAVIGALEKALLEEIPLVRLQQKSLVSLRKLKLIY